MTPKEKPARRWGRSAGRRKELRYSGPNYQGFRAAMQAAGIEPPADLAADGKLHRFTPSGKRGDDAGWYVLHPDHPAAGAFGNWRTGQSETWCAARDCDLSPAEKTALAHRVERIRVEQEREAKARTDAAASVSGLRWAAASLCLDHPYLSAKGVKSHGIRVEGWHTLLVPMRDTAGKLWGLQSIYPDGTKRFMPRQRVQGCYHAIGKPSGRLLVCEGYATGATLHEQTGDAVAVAFNAGNLLAVARALRAKFPDVDLVLCADDDWQTEGNPGLTKAREAAAAVGGRLAVPDFTGLPRGPKDTDFNDLARLGNQPGKGEKNAI
jgi:putative DNA primase/helicase